jgi:hypothetical protein
MNDQIKFSHLISKSLDLMEDKPTGLGQTVAFIANQQEIEFPEPLQWLKRHLEQSGTNSAVFHAMGLALRKWDRMDVGAWAEGTPPFSAARRGVVYRRLGLPADMHSFLNQTMPVFQESDQAIVIADKHVEWYSERFLKDGFYWKAYSNYLLKTKKWDDDAVAKLDHSTDEVVRRLADPCGNQVYRSKGLVVGYVQSGKTANFSGVLAKAADAGYRFIIVLAGTLDILRSQTQRRLDKELVGRELLESDYASDADWNEFLSHGGRPSDLGAFDWERLTGPNEDYRELKLAGAALEFKPLVTGKPYNDPDSLRSSPLRIIVIKKVPKVMARVARDLAKIRTKLAHVPALIVDDESDQASINTLDPSKPTGRPEKARTETNKQIVNLLNTLPRAQYLGYTATPFANVFVDLNDPEDLFPKDFIISLPRPKGYMGVLDFYDFDTEPVGFDSNQRAFIRDVRGEDCGGDLINGNRNPNHLQKAIDCFVLAGAIKLFRERRSGGTCFYKHHTMLVHHSVSKADHDRLAEKVKETFENAGYVSGKGIERLKNLLESDFIPVSRAKGKGHPMPSSFAELAPFVGECHARLIQEKPVRIVNGDYKDDTPDFDKAGVWAILVGGTKLSRGYTVEGLTITYFRRVSTATDTLMQMGRWFGYRPGYGDLVRLFIGRDEPFGNKGKNRLDLYEAFEAICRDEEKFRQEIMKYRGDTTPKDIPPLVPSHLTTLRPTAKNKMYNSYITFKNYGGEWSEPTLAPTEQNDALHNEKIAIELLLLAGLKENKFSGKKTGKDGKLEGCDLNAFCGLVKNVDMLKFLEAYHWKDRRSVLQHEMEFMKGSEGDPGIEDWLVILPIVSQTKGAWPKKMHLGMPQIPIQKRSRIGQRFKVYSTSSHRAVAEYIANIGDSFRPSNSTADSLRRKKRAVMLFYPVQDEGDSFVSVGFALVFPENKITKRISYAVRDPNRPGDVVIPLDGDGA